MSPPPLIRYVLGRLPTIARRMTTLTVELHYNASLPMYHTLYPHPIVCFAFPYSRHVLHVSRKSSVAILMFPIRPKRQGIDAIGVVWYWVASGLRNTCDASPSFRILPAHFIAPPTFIYKWPSPMQLILSRLYLCTQRAEHRGDFIRPMVSVWYERQDTLLLTWFIFSGHLCSKRRLWGSGSDVIASGLPHAFLRGDLCLLLPFACIPFTSERLLSLLWATAHSYHGQGSIFNRLKYNRFCQVCQGFFAVFRANFTKFLKLVYAVIRICHSW